MKKKDLKEPQEFYNRKLEIWKRIYLSRQKRVEDAFNYIKKTFFPNWDKKNKWKVFVAKMPSNLGCYASCDHVNKAIWFRRIPRNEIELLVFMLDEISHARVPGLIQKGHGREWVRNMRQAEKIAKEKKLTRLAKAINFHIRVEKAFKKHDEEQFKRYLEKEKKSL